jgi:Mycobacterium 19 kDa lipoprotein antigen
VPGNNASATKDGNNYKVTGTATGVAEANPTQQVSKPFEIDVTCPWPTRWHEQRGSLVSFRISHCVVGSRGWVEDEFRRASVRILDDGSHCRNESWLGVAKKEVAAREEP